MSAPIQLTKETFRSFIEEQELPVLVDFWASWCGPCRMIAPLIEEIAEGEEGKLIVAKVNIDEEPDVATSFQVTSIPTLIVFRGGKKVDRLVGANPQALLQMVERVTE